MRKMHKRTAWLIINEFLNSNKFNEINQYLLIAAGSCGIKMNIVTNAECMAYISSNRSGVLLHETLPDFVLFWDKDIRLAKHLELLGLPVFNSSYAIEACDDKRLTHILLQNKNIPMPKTIIAPFTYDNIGYNNLDFLVKAEEELNYPFIIKEAYGSFGQQVYLVTSHEESEERIHKIGARPMLFQEFISMNAGSDLRLQVVGDQVIAAMLRYSVTGDFRANLTLGGKMESYTPDTLQIELACKAAKALQLDFCGVDLLFGDNEEPILCEVNSNAHFKNIYDCTGVNAAIHIMEHILNKIK